MVQSSGGQPACPLNPNSLTLIVIREKSYTMARTVHTMERHASSRSSSSEGNNSHADGGGGGQSDDSDDYDNNNSFCNKEHQKKMSSTTSRAAQSSYIAAVQSTAPNQTIRNMSSRFDSDADYSSTVARMPIPSSSSSSYIRRDDNYSHEYYSEEFQQRNNNDHNMSYYKFPSSDWNSSYRGRGGRDNSPHYHAGRGGRGGRGQYHSSRQQRYNNSHPPYYDDGKWG